LAMGKPVALEARRQAEIISEAVSDHQSAFS